MFSCDKVDSTIYKRTGTTIGHIPVLYYREISTKTPLWRTKNMQVVPSCASGDDRTGKGKAILFFSPSKWNAILDDTMNEWYHRKAPSGSNDILHSLELRIAHVFLLRNPARHSRWHSLSPYDNLHPVQYLRWTSSELIRRSDGINISLSAFCFKSSPSLVGTLRCNSWCRHKYFGTWCKLQFLKWMYPSCAISKIKVIYELTGRIISRWRVLLSKWREPWGQLYHPDVLRLVRHVMAYFSCFAPQFARLYLLQ